MYNSKQWFIKKFLPFNDCEVRFGFDQSMTHRAKAPDEADDAANVSKMRNGYYDLWVDIVFA